MTVNNGKARRPGVVARTNDIPMTREVFGPERVRRPIGAGPVREGDDGPPFLCIYRGASHGDAGPGRVDFVDGQTVGVAADGVRLLGRLYNFRGRFFAAAEEVREGTWCTSGRGRVPSDLGLELALRAVFLPRVVRELDGADAYCVRSRG